MTGKNKIRHYRRHGFTLLSVLAFLGLLTIQDAIESAGHRNEKTLNKSSAYAGHDHANDPDMANTIRTYPFLAGTVLDDCRLCHRAGTVNNQPANNCDYCHAVYETRGFGVTLNPFGNAYAEKGRVPEAFKAIETADSDSDGFTNLAELQAGTQPGEARSKPGLKTAPCVVLNTKELNQIKRHSQFLLMNAHRSSDFYANYSGWRITDILLHLGSMQTATHITAISHDGFKKDYAMADIVKHFPRSIFYGNMDTPGFLGDCPAWVEYPDGLPMGVETGKPIRDEQRLMLADRRNGKPLKPVHQSKSGHLAGEGPYRIVVPQNRISPPDQPMDTSNPQWPNPFDETAHHNASDSARGVIAIAVHPLPDGTKEPDWRARADELLQSGSIMFFGAIKVETPFPTEKETP